MWVFLFCACSYWVEVWALKFQLAHREAAFIVVVELFVVVDDIVNFVVVTLLIVTDTFYLVLVKKCYSEAPEGC